MSQFINELATVEISDDLLEQLDLASIGQDLSKNYRKLDDLKKAKAKHESKGWLGRLFSKGELKKAQFDSAIVQADFSKSVGQLLVISIMQSKKLAEQQALLNSQQEKLRSQADDLADHAGKLNEQHQVLAEQSQQLKDLVNDYFALKGLTDDEAKKLTEIAGEVKATRDGLLREFERRSKDVDALCAEIKLRIDTSSAQVAEHIRLSAEQVRSVIVAVQDETHTALAANESNLRAYQDSLQNELNQGLENLAQGQREAETALQSRYSVLDSRLSVLSENQAQQNAAHQEKLSSIDGAVEGLTARSSELATAFSGMKADLAGCVEQQKMHQKAMAVFQQEASRNLSRLRTFAVGLSLVVLGQLGALVYLMK